MFNIQPIPDNRNSDHYCNFHRGSEDIGQTHYFSIAYAPSNDANRTVFHICNVCYSRFIDRSVSILHNTDTYVP